jgi:hypothetical protein
MTEHSEERDQTAPGKAVQENMPEPEEMPGGTLGRDRPRTSQGTRARSASTSAARRRSDDGGGSRPRPRSDRSGRPGIPDEPMTPRSGESFLAPPEESPPDGREKEPDQGDAADIPVPPPPD